MLSQSLDKLLGSMKFESRDTSCPKCIVLIELIGIQLLKIRNHLTLARPQLFHCRSLVRLDFHQIVVCRLRMVGCSVSLPFSPSLAIYQHPYLMFNLWNPHLVIIFSPHNTMERVYNCETNMNPSLKSKPTMDFKVLVDLNLE